MVLIQNGDHRAFEQLYDRYAHRLNAFFYKMLWSDRELAEDSVHDLFTKIIDRPELFKPDFEVKPWLFRIASNMCKNTYRKRAFENEYRSQLEEQGIALSGVEQKLDEELQFDLLSKALDKLEEDRRTLFLLRYQQDLSVKELSDIYDLPEGTIKSRLFYIKKILAGAIEYDKTISKNEK